MSEEGTAPPNGPDPRPDARAEDPAAPPGDDDDDDDASGPGAALVFGASGDQGRAVASGLLDSGYGPVYGATRDVTTASAVEVSNMGCHLLEVDPADVGSIERALSRTGASAIFLVTTTEMPPGGCDTFAEAEEREYGAIKGFFDALVGVHESDGVPRHVVFSCADDVRRMTDELSVDGERPLVDPLDDGSVCAHFTGKARGGEYGLGAVRDVPGLSLTLVTLPLLHSNFMGFAVPLPNEARTQWTINAAFGDGEIDMFSSSDLSRLVPSLLEDRDLYDGYNVRVTAERMGLDEVARTFSDLFGRDVIYDPLTTEEMAELPFPSAPAMAQMCRFLGDPRSSHDLEVTEAVMFPQRPQRFRDWLLTHSDHEAFDAVGLTCDPGPILSVTVFGATGPEGTSVVKGLLADNRKRYRIRVTSRDVSQGKAVALRDLDPDRVELFRCNFDDVDSCAAAVDGVDGAFLVTDYFDDAGGDPDAELRHAKNVIDACESSRSVRHVVFSTLEDIDEMNRRLGLNLPAADDGRGGGTGTVVPPSFDSKAKAAAYARTRRLSCTYVLMPVYSERFFELLAPEMREDGETGEKSMVMHLPKHGAKSVGGGGGGGGSGSGGGDGGGDPQVMCMSIDELGPAVANIFDSYQVYAGHEIGLVTDFVTISEVAEMITEVFFEETDEDGNVTKGKVEKKDVTVDAWVEKRDTVAKDLGQMFSYYAKTDAVKMRRSVAKTLQLLPDAKPMREWLEQNRDNVTFRQRLGLR